MPEKKINEISAGFREMFDKGMTAYQRQNLDYAITIFGQILEKEPGFYDCREALRAAQFKRASASAGFFKKTFSKASNAPLLAKAQMTTRNNPLETMLLAEQVLNTDPYSTMAHKLLADAAMIADLPKTAVLSLEIIHKNSPKDKGIALRLAEALPRVGQLSKAEEIYRALLAADPSDTDIPQRLKDLAADRTMNEGGYGALADGKGSYRDILKDKKASVAMEQEQREVKTEDVADNLIREYEARLLTEPSNLKLMRSLAELWAQKEEFDKALAYYHRMEEAGQGSDAALEKAIIDMTLKKFNNTLDKLDRQSPDYEIQSAQIHADMRAYEISECQRRVEKYPTDLAIRFEMGVLYYQAGKISEAIQELQKAQTSPHKRIPSLYHLGLCFGKRGMFDLAARTFQNAIKEKQLFDDEKKELIYSLGCMLEKLKKTEEAIEQFKLIYEVDIGYKDVAAKVDAYYAGQ
jgi:tetratricopeptide (TPR) repeat protein